MDRNFLFLRFILVDHLFTFKKKLDRSKLLQNYSFSFNEFFFSAIVIFIEKWESVTLLVSPHSYRTISPLKLPAISVSSGVSSQAASKFIWLDQKGYKSVLNFILRV